MSRNVALHCWCKCCFQFKNAEDFHFHIPMEEHVCENPRLVFMGKFVRSLSEVKMKAAQQKQEFFYSCSCGYFEEERKLCENNIMLHSQVSGRSFECTLCERKFPDMKDMMAHMLWRHGENKLFPCEVCGDVYHHVAQKQVHESMHEIVKTFWLHRM